MGNTTSVATRAQVIELLEGGHTYETAARELRIPPGQAFMIATGLPADGGDGPLPEELAGKPVLDGSPQRLVNPAAFNPTRKPHVLEWVKRRAARDLESGS
ncbi:MAG TPA: hypothetical protein VH025_08150 [Solirubrobacteraceae bacterium]|jgi:hypothetical protein|nr:hypothetical protein [Solirubrobacteraceae bacterium]